ncbi:hypothetical protein CG09_0184 [Riemerella anatipestifer]|nr:hypothetical protein G148_1453 [Riemerella anatipestifer RA-CH-2]AKP70472.1 hypothetical protein CG09_0184 [Riemerella anatipestifer]
MVILWLWLGYLSVIRWFAFGLSAVRQRFADNLHPYILLRF